MKEILIYGLGDFAKLVLHYFSKDINIKVVAFCADKEYIKEQKFCNLPVVSFEQLENLYSSEKYSIFVAAGYSFMRNRVIMYEKIKLKGYTCVNYISSQAVIDSTVEIGENNLILENCVIEPFTIIGNNNIIWSSCNICHDVNIESHSFIASQSLLGGFACVRDNCFLGFNSTVLQYVTLAKETLVGAKSLILSNTEEYSKYIGNPAINVGNHKENGISIQ